VEGVSFNKLGLTTVRRPRALRCFRAFGASTVKTLTAPTIITFSNGSTLSGHNGFEAFGASLLSGFYLDRLKMS